MQLETLLALSLKQQSHLVTKVNIASYPYTCSLDFDEGWFMRTLRLGFDFCLSAMQIALVYLTESGPLISSWLPLRTGYCIAKPEARRIMMIIN